MPNQTTPPTLYQDTAIQDMMGRPPGWLLHSGPTAIAVVFMVVLGLTALIRYPERVEAPFVLQTEKIPLELYANSMSIVDTVFAQSGTTVTVGDTLLIFRSETDWKPVSALDHWLTEVESNLHLAEGDFKVARLVQSSNVPATESSKYPASLQQPYANLRATLSAYSSYQKTNGLNEEIAALNREIEDANRLSTSLNRQVSLYDRELDFQQKHADRMQDLEADGIVSTQEAEQVAIQTISARRQREVLVSRVSSKSPEHQYLLGF
jgi:pyruvate/2-oxoglutarate dehydrogenase complex dihydrolipoamide acyltransferase (E2) component